MSRSVTVLMVVTLAGCHGPLQRRAMLGEPCPEACPPPAAACPPKIEVQTPETIVVRPPTPKVVCEQPPAPSPGFGGAPQPPQMPQAVPMGYYPMPQPGFGGAPGFGGGGLVGGEIRDRTAVGVMFDTIRIPIPWLRLKAIAQPAEVTFRSQLVPPSGFGGAPVVMGGGFGGVPMGGYGGGGQMVYTGTQYVPVQGTMPVQVPGGAAAGGGAVPPGFGGAGGAAAETADAVEKLKQKLKECEDLQAKLKALQPAGEKK